MLNRNQEMGLQIRRMQDIENYIVSDVEEIPCWNTREGKLTGDHQYLLVSEEWAEIKLGESWRCGSDTIRWFRTVTEIPKRFAGQEVKLVLDTGGEGIVRINGEIVSGLISFLSPNKEERHVVTVPAGMGPGLEIEIEAAYNYQEAGGKLTEKVFSFQKAQLEIHNIEVEQFYYDITAFFEAMQAVGGNVFGAYRSALPLVPNYYYDVLLDFNKDDALYEKLYHLFTGTLNLLNVNGSREDYLSSIREAAAYFREEFGKISGNKNVTITAVGNSHIDTAWMWPVKETIRKCAITFSNALALMDKYPEFTYSQSQPVLYEYVKKYYPDLFEKIRKRVQEGRWELVGNSWVEADANLPSGESLVRQLLYGRNFFLREFGKASDIFWLPDVFGYCWSLPQILKKSGIRYFMTCKLNSNDINKFCKTLFRWQGVDGSIIPTYIQKISYASDMTPFFMHYAWWDFNEKDKTSDVMLAYGYGDGGGGPTEHMVEFARRYENFPGMANVNQDTASAYFRRIEPIVDTLPVWKDELYYERHRGCYTSQAMVKKNNRQSELLYRSAEIAAVLAEKLCEKDYPMETLTENWKLILLNQFHDILPGSSIREVYEVAEKEYAAVRQAGETVLSDSLSALSKQIQHGPDSLIVWNTLPFERTEQVAWKTEQDLSGKAAYGPDGEEYPIVARNGKASFMAKVPAMGYAVYQIGERTKKKRESIFVSKNWVENQYYRILLDQNGNIASLFDKKNGLEVLKDHRRYGVMGNTLMVFDDEPEKNEAWDIDMEYEYFGEMLNNVESIEVIEANEVRGILRTRRRYRDSWIQQDLVLYNGMERIDFITKIDWKESQKMLKAAFSVDVISSRATYEIPYGAIERPTHRNTSWDTAKFEVPAHKWADLSDNGYGVAILNDCKYGYDIKENLMRLTLLRSPISPDPSADQCMHEFTYSLYPHAGTAFEGGVVKQAYSLNVPLYAQYEAGSHSGPLSAAHSFFEVQGENVLIEAIKKAEDGDGMIVRLYESAGASSKAALVWKLPAISAEECNLMEEGIAPVLMANNRISFDVGPFEIKTFRIR